jgi:hypothetical protein
LGRTAVAKIMCPNEDCKTVSHLPDAYLGRRVTCKKCKTSFVASVLSEAPTAPSPSSSEVLTVVARRVGAKGPGLRTNVPEKESPLPGQELRTAPPARRTAMMVAAALSLLLPIMAASGFVAWKGFGKPGEEGAGETYAAIEIGSKGVKYVPCRIYPSGDIEPLLNTDPENTNIVWEMGKTGYFDPEGLKTTVKVVAKFHELLEKQHQVAPDRIFVVGSSGLFGALESRKDPEKTNLIEKNKTALDEAVQNATGKHVEFMSLDQEISFQLKGMVRSSDLDSALLVDIGSGGTRGGYLEEKTGVLRTLKGLGVTPFYKDISSQVTPGDSFVKVAGASQRRLRQEFHEQTVKNPGLLERDKVYLSGGIVWVMATYRHPKERANRVKLDANDIDIFVKDVRSDPNLLSSFTPPASLKEAERTKLESDIKSMRKNFNPEQLIAGAEILEALSTELKLREKKERWWFRHSHIAWVAAYVNEQSRLKK